ncbi:hypothetical protein H6F43_19670 [Leptolyngbya sp. FACHB-36]|uniref:hypothetical protein n=1 Tax=Leptolyngbya sp. FACHB-36 TaxID=2692808 RepID=UPI0016811FEA|nr:hypothetical protein [Leptolyngbya sp. FACHB-36]MBD2022404.1 hypothetical protein [Leptolyngbya sp. FACHB-36]
MRLIALLIPVLSIVLSLAPISALAAPPLPAADRQGDYTSRTSHTKWIVTDPDSNGVNCRWSKAMPADWFNPEAKLPPATYSQWSVVRQFKRNTVLNANTAPAGFALMYDVQNKPWLKVNLGPNDRICLVRANARFIRPI